jgi:carboxypeptidase C (cathepsin A)
VTPAIRRVLLLAAISLASVPGRAEDLRSAVKNEQAAEIAQPSHGSVRLGQRDIGYTVTPGNLIVRDDDGNPIVSMFYVAYVADRAATDPERPVTFLFNGGPGSSSMFLHLGSIAPVRIVFPNATSIPPPPYDIQPNPYSMIDHSDLVFLDMVGTGFSRTLGKAKDSDFWSVDKDADVFARAIRRYLTINKRWNSPKFLFGESYGTTRATALAYRLSTLGGGGIHLNGVILLGVNLNHGIYLPGLDQYYIDWLPGYAATAWYHHRISPRPEALEPFLAEVRQWVSGRYSDILAKGYDATDEERREVARQYAVYTGLPEDVVLGADLRVDLGTFRKRLLLDQGLTVGRLDSRFTGSDADDQGGAPEYDATTSFNAGPFAAGINHYLLGMLGYRTDLEYRPNANGKVASVWDRGHVSPSGERMALANTSLDLARTMRENRDLKVLVLSGYYDLATPFFKTEYDVKHMRIDRELQRNISFAYFESGHMIYTNPSVMPLLKSVLDSFYEQATYQPPAHD